MYGCDSWTIKKVEHQRTDAFQLWCWRTLLRVPWTAKRLNQSILKEINPEYSLEGLMLKLKHQYSGHLMWSESLSVGSDSLRPCRLRNVRLPHVFTISWSLLRLISIEVMMPSNYLILCHHLLFLPLVFPASGSFAVCWLFASVGQSIGASASVLPMNIQHWFPLGLTGLISLLSKGLARVFSSTTIGKHQFYDVQPSLWSDCHIDTWLLEKP